MEMAEGDTLVLFTDGIPEAMNEVEELYSFERFEQVLIDHRHGEAQTIIDAVLSDVQAFADGRAPEDDITLVVLKATESFAAAPTIRRSARR